MQQRIDGLASKLREYDGPPLRLMEVCGTHTAAISKLGIASLLPDSIRLISGPGCPVCVTPAGYIDALCALAKRDDTTVLTFGDMLRVPGRKTSLMEAQAEGGSLRMMYSPMEAVRLAQAQPERRFVVAALGFETTLPLYALLVRRLQAEGVGNVRLLSQLKALLPCLCWLCDHDPAIHGFIGPGHVSAILGAEAYGPFCETYRRPVAIAGFGYEHLVIALHDLISQITKGRHRARNFYPSVVLPKGNEKAQRLIGEFFVPKASPWRGMGEIPGSGYGLAPAYAAFEEPMNWAEEDQDPAGCRCASVILGRCAPRDCPLFGKTCTPENPVGPCMVSSEGTCGIWYQTDRMR